MQYHVMTFNLLTAHLYDFGRNRFSRRCPAILRLIREQNPDIIGVQELTPAAEQALQPLWRSYGATGEYRWKKFPFFNESNAVFFRSDRFRLLESSTFWLSETPEIPSSKLTASVFPRIAVFAVMRDLQSGTEFTIINVHLDHGLERVRTRQSEILCRLAQQHSAGSFSVMTGDFNTVPDSAAIRNLRNAGFTDLVSPAFGSTLRGKTGTFAHHNQPIDHILIRGNIRMRRIMAHRTCYDGIYPSDHWPVTALLEE